MLTASIVRYPVAIAGETADIGTANELANALDVLHGQHDRAILEQLRPHLADIIGNAAGLTNVLRALETADQIFLIQALGVQLSVVLQQARFLRDLFAILADDEVEQCLIETLGATGLRVLILTASELGEVLEWVYGQRDRQVLDLLGTPYLKRLIRTGAARDRVDQRWARLRVLDACATCRAGHAPARTLFARTTHRSDRQSTRLDLCGRSVGASRSCRAPAETGRDISCRMNKSPRGNAIRTHPAHWRGLRAANIG
jgi:hypothetical protein